MPTNLDQRRLLITGVLTTDSMAYAVADAALRHGAEVILTNIPRALSLTRRVAQRLPGDVVDVLPLDVTDPEQIEQLHDTVAQRWEHIDGLLHAIAFAPESALGGNFLTTPWDDVATAMQISAYSLKALTVGLLPLLEKAPDGAGVVSLDFDASVAWPVYDWMGPAKAALESVTRYLARDLGPRNIRVNAIAAGPIRTMAGKSIAGFDTIAEGWQHQAPLGWDTTDPTIIAEPALFLLSPHARGITGEILHVDGGYHAMGAPTHPPHGAEAQAP
jgi:enoyl-[acyl-carrier protein] reductase I